MKSEDNSNDPGDAQKNLLSGDKCGEPTDPCLELMDALEKDAYVLELRLGGNYGR